MQAGQCANQMGTKFREYFGDNDAQLGRTNLFLAPRTHGAALQGGHQNLLMD
jgi:hypothetical protein